MLEEDRMEEDEAEKRAHEEWTGQAPAEKTKAVACCCAAQQRA